MLLGLVGGAIGRAGLFRPWLPPNRREERDIQKPTIFVDADGCPVKNEVFRVAKRYLLKVVLVANSRMHVPDREGIELVVVGGDFDAADDWIAGHAAENDVVVSADVPLAARCVAKGALVLGPKGRIFTEDSIGEAVADRNLMSHSRDLGLITGGPAPFTKQDRSRFLQSLDKVVGAAIRAMKGGS